MADKICPPVKSSGVPDGLNMPSSHTVLTTPDPNFGGYFGANTPGNNAVNDQKIMGKK